MRVGYFDCIGGISGDMILGALVDAGVDFDLLNKELAGLDLNGFTLDVREVYKQDIRASKVTVRETTDPGTRTLDDIKKIIGSSSISETVRMESIKVFEELARAESQAHGVDIENVHFHEVGATDAIVDITGAIIGLSMLDIDEVYCSPLPLANPAPATTVIIKDMAVRGIDSPIETVTPTGASIMKALATQTPVLPSMKVDRTGCGAGSADTERPNIVRLFVGESSQDVWQAKDGSDTVRLIETNIDDMTPETIGYTCEALLAGGALDVWCSPIYMKKNRPAVTLSFLCEEDRTNKLIEILFKETGTLGLRVSYRDRIILDRTIVEVDTEFGKIPVKTGVLDDRVVSTHPEYEVCAHMARESGVPLEKIVRAALSAFEKAGLKTP